MNWSACHWCVAAAVYSSPSKIHACMKHLSHLWSLLDKCSMLSGVYVSLSR